MKINNINWICVETYEEMSRLAAEKLASQLKNKPDSVLGLATGSTPIGLYQNLVKACRAGEISFADAKSVNLDEYVGLDASHPQSYRYFMNDNLFSHVDIKEENINIPQGCAEDIAAECVRYSAKIRELGGVDIQLLGVGNNGHIAFNEPCDRFIGRTHEVPLTESTREANARFFDSIDEVPKSALTMGIADIFEAKEILLVANGEKKIEILKKAFEGDIDPDIPVSILLLHPNVTVIVTPEASK